MPLITYISLALALTSAVIVLIIQVPRLLRVIRKANCENAQDYDFQALPGVSVIVYSHNNNVGLERLIPQLMAQKYPEGRFEVVVINDGANPATESLLLLLESSYPDRLRHTFTPADTRGLSSKNLALMLGIKSARNPVILHTTADVSIESENWAATVAAQFSRNNETEIVIGCGILTEGKLFRRRMHLIDTVNYLASAIAGKPWRGDGCCLAYTRKLFFDNKGFSSLLNLRNGGGDDDAYISAVANAENTAVCVARDGIVEISPDDVVSYWKNNARRRKWAWRQCRNSARRLQGGVSILTWLSLLSAIFAAITWNGDIVILSASIGSQLLMWIVLMCLWRRVSILLKAPKFLFSVPWVMLLRPLRTIYHFRFG